MTPVGNGVVTTLGDHERRLDRLEAVEPAVLAERVRLLSLEVRSMRRALWGFCFSVLVIAVSFGLSAVIRAGGM